MTYMEVGNAIGLSGTILAHAIAVLPAWTQVLRIRLKRLLLVSGTEILNYIHVQNFFYKCSNQTSFLRIHALTTFVHPALQSSPNSLPYEVPRPCSILNGTRIDDVPVVNTLSQHPCCSTFYI